MLCLLVLVSAGACKSRTKPNKIAHLTTFNSRPDGAHVEFVGWINSTAGDKDVGIELHISDTPNTYPQAFVELKDEQPDPGEGHEVCVSGQISRRDELNGSTIYWIKDGKLIDCY